MPYSKCPDVISSRIRRITKMRRKTDVAELLRSLARAISKHPLRSAGHAFVAFSVLWTITEAAYHFTEWTHLKGGIWVTATLVFSIVHGVYSGRQLRRIELQFLDKTVKVEVLAGDILALDGTTAIQVSEYFESELGLPVSPSSLHGEFIKRCFGGHPQAFDDQIARGFGGIQPVHMNKQVGKSARYPIGTTVPLTANDKRYLVFAFTRADVETCKASADVPLMFEALAGLWAKARTVLGGDTLNVPLIGSSLSGVGWPTRELVHMIILSFVDFSRRQMVTGHLRIVLTPNKIDELNLRQLGHYWKER
ncbi:MAG: hypothetical protein JNL98_09145 [Bryobacterales bacterium]|nr:hypothetical protein [Bryobacterales bacterium]